MNSVVQPKQTTPVFVVALMLFGFAIAQSVHAVTPEPGHPPNHPVFRVNVDVSTSPCPGEIVHLSGELHLHFKTDHGVAEPNSSNCSPPGSTLCAATLEGVTGTGVTSGRTYVASNPFFSDWHVNNSKGTWILKFHVIGMPNSPPQGDPCPGCIYRFTLQYTVKWESRNGKVHSAHATPEVLCH